MHSLIDFAQYGLSDSEVRSVSAMASFWRTAVSDVTHQDELGKDAGFVELLSGLAGSIGDVEWQREWIRTWDRLTDQGVELGALFHILFAVMQQAEQALLAGQATLRPIHLDLCLVFRRGVFAVCSGAIEAKEAIRNARSGISGEVAAVHALTAMAAEHRRVAILSVSLLNRDTHSQFSASDLQELPSLILERFQHILRPDDMVFTGREGEWLLLLPDVASKVQPSLAAARIERAFVEPVGLSSGRLIRLAVAIGAALLPDHGRESEQALHAARLARWAIPAGGERFGWFRAEQTADWRQRAELIDELRDALARESLELYLQPQIDLESNLCIGAELLLRWQRADGEWVPPPLIIELIEQHGWHGLFTDWLIRSAMRIAAELDALRIGITLSINLTVSDLLDPELPELLGQRTETWNIPSHRFILELTESAMMRDHQSGLAAIERLRAQGFQMSLDDFGTGYSSLSYLVSLPIHELKVDRSFVVAMFDSEENMRVVRTIIDLATDLGMVPLAEGIDDERQLEQLKRLGCRVGQGYLFAKPMGQADFVRWFRQRRHVGSV